MNRKIFDEIWSVGKDFAGSLAAHAFFQEGNKAKGLRPEVIQVVAPHFAKKQADEARFAAVMMKVNPCFMPALIAFLASLGPNQRAHFILTVAEMTVSAKEEDAVNFLSLIGDAVDDSERVKIAVAHRFIRERENQYPLGWMKEHGWNAPDLGAWWDRANTWLENTHDRVGQVVADTVRNATEGIADSAHNTVGAISDALTDADAAAGGAPLTWSQNFRAQMAARRAARRRP